MTDRHAQLDEALEHVVTAIRIHLEAVKTADGRVDDDGVWKAYVALNNASYAYDELMLDAYGEVTPWDVDLIDPDLADEKLGSLGSGTGSAEPDDPHTHIVSVRQRRDYRIPSVSALLQVAEVARQEAMSGEEDAADPVESVGEAILELLQSGDGSLSALDVPELEPLDGIVAVAEVDTALDLGEFEELDGAGPFTLIAPDRLVGRLDEHPYADHGEDSDVEDDDEDGDDEDLDDEDGDDEDLDDEDGDDEDLDDEDMDDEDGDGDDSGNKEGDDANYRNTNHDGEGS